MNELVISILLSLGGATAIACAIRYIAREPVRWWAFATALVSVIGYWALVVLGAELQTLLAPVIDLRWNWLGKLFSSAALLTLVMLSPNRFRHKTGMRLRQSTGSILPCMICILLLCALSWSVEAWAADGTDTSIERLAFQAIMPGLDEEIFFRGIFLTLLMRAFQERWMLFGGVVGPAAAIATFIFAAGHGLVYSNGAVHFDAVTFVVTGTLGFGLLWIRQRSGSVLLAVLGHNIINFGNSFF